MNNKHLIIEEQLGIPPDYQFKALQSKNFFQSNWHNNKLVALSYILEITNAQKILDLGTGSGNFELTFADKVTSIVGIDYNQKALKFLDSKLKEKAIKNVRLICKDIQLISTISDLGKFDLIIIVDVIEHLKIEAGEKLIERLKKFLSKDGKICIITPNYKSPWLIIERILDKFTALPHLEGEQHLAKYHEKNLKQIFIDKGYRPIFFKSFNLFSFALFNKSLASLFCKLELSLSLPNGNLIISLFQIKD